MINWLERNFVSRNMVDLTIFQQNLALTISGLSLNSLYRTVRSTMSRIVSFDSDKRDCVDAVLEHILLGYDN